MAILDDFIENFELLLYTAYEPDRDYPVMVCKGKNTGGGICCRNFDALHKLREIEKQLDKLNNDILKFFEVPDYELSKRKR